MHKNEGKNAWHNARCLCQPTVKSAGRVFKKKFQRLRMKRIKSVDEVTDGGLPEYSGDVCNVPRGVFLERAIVGERHS